MRRSTACAWKGDGARTLLQLLLPTTSGKLPDSQQLSAEVRMEDGEIEKITISASGTLKDKAQTPFTLYVTIDDFDAAASFSVPDEVLESLDKTYADGELPVITSDLLPAAGRLGEPLRARDAGGGPRCIPSTAVPVVVKNALRYYRQKVDGVTVNCINKSGLNIFFSDTGSAVNADGEQASGRGEEPYRNGEASGRGVSRLPERRTLR